MKVEGFQLREPPLAMEEAIAGMPLSPMLLWPMFRRLSFANLPLISASERAIMPQSPIIFSWLALARSLCDACALLQIMLTACCAFCSFSRGSAHILCISMHVHDI